MSDETHINGDYPQGDKISGDKVAGDKVSGDKVSGDKHEYHYTPPHFPLHNLPQPNPNFTGRQDLLQAIASNFTPSPHSPPIPPGHHPGHCRAGRRRQDPACPGLRPRPPPPIRPGLAAACRRHNRTRWRPAPIRHGTARLPLHQVDAPTARQLV
ncbi:MAG: hypothetical protein R3E31_26545 [Chloroflexota bacterium]